MDQHGGCLQRVRGDDDCQHLLEVLPPGFRFHPTDEELITHYLSRKAADAGFIARAIGEIDLNKIEPWDLPRRAKMGGKEWYFFSVRDRKYPTGLRTNRATEAGYWKATGKDKEIHRGGNLVGMKKTLVFYRGRAPKGDKSPWVMHEFRLDGNLSLSNLIPTTAKNEWVICRVFQKSLNCSTAACGGAGGGGGKKVHATGLVKAAGSSSYVDADQTMMMMTTMGAIAAGTASQLLMPPSLIMDPAKGMVRASPAASGAAHVTCFSNSTGGQQGHSEQPYMDYFAGVDPSLFSASTNVPLSSAELVSSWPPLLLSSMPLLDGGAAALLSGSQLPAGSSSGTVQLPQNQNQYGSGVVMTQGYCNKAAEEQVGGSLSQETGLTCDMNPEISSGPMDDCLWNC